MKPLVGSRFRWATLVAVLLGLTAGGIAYASIPDPSGVIHGCYKTSGGALRVIDPSTSSCLASETPLAWNQTGPIGPRGPSDAYLASDLGEGPITADGTTLVSKTLPAGNYTLVAKFGLYNSGFDDIADCVLTDGTSNLRDDLFNGLVFDEDTVRIEGSNISSDNEFMDLVGTISLPSSGTVSVVCVDLETTGQLFSENSQLLATQVATLH